MLRCFRRGGELERAFTRIRPCIVCDVARTAVFTGPSQSDKSVKFDRAYAIFDPSSGNLLVAGIWTPPINNQDKKWSPFFWPDWIQTQQYSPEH